jgi:SAM-dependent methyltransferase
MTSKILCLTLIALLVTGPGCASPVRITVPAEAPALPDCGPDIEARQRQPCEAARRMIRASRGTLVPVYAPLADQIVEDYGLADREGVGIDLGSGPGTLIVELCRRTDMHWINADINPHFFSYFYRLATANGVGHRVSAVRADACDLPFHDAYADVIVSRGSYHFWGRTRDGFSEVYRVLKPGGVAYIGRGFPRGLPVAVAREVRSRQGKRISYDVQAAAEELRAIMEDLGIKDYRVEVPRPEGAGDLNYGVWVEFHKPESNIEPATPHGG